MMGTFSDYADSPTIFFPPHYHTYNSYNPIPRARVLQPPQESLPDPTQQTASRPTIVTKASHKRSRDEVDDSLDALNCTPHATAMTEKPIIYGKGMTLVDPVTGKSTSTESQTGTWYEGYIEEEYQASIRAAESLAKDVVLSRDRPAKCQRLDLPPKPPVKRNASLLTSANGPSDLFASLAIDAASVMLGVGWTVISTNEHTQCATRGWTKYIENYYPSLTNVEILLKSEGREAFLIKAMGPAEGLYLFSEDLAEARLLAHDWDSCIAILRASPAVVGGLETLRAITTPVISTTEGTDYLQDPRSGTWMPSGNGSWPSAIPLDLVEGMNLD